MTGRARRLAIASWFTIASAAALLAIAPGTGTAGAQTLPKLTQPVSDFAHVIDAANAAEIDRRIRILESTTHDAIAVVTIETFAPFASIDEYAVKQFESAGIGTRQKDSGVLIVVAVKERRVRIEAGYGSEEFITDGFAGDVIRQAILPAFRESRYGDGVLAGTTRVIQKIAQGRGVTLPEMVADTREPREDQGGFPPLALLVGIIVLYAIVSSIRGGGGSSFGRRGGRNTWSGWSGGMGGFGGGGFGGGGFGGGGGGSWGGFGGGRSGGGGASGGW
ncbi:MAG: TPM domain-containing protein [Acidobacteriota bacterium]